MTWVEYMKLKMVLLQFALLNLREPMRGKRVEYKNIDPARRMDDREVRIYGAGGCIGRYGNA